MPRYNDDRYGNTRLYVGRLSSRTRSRDLEDVFSRYGRAKYHTLRYLSHDGLTVSGKRFRRVRDVDLKHDFAFIEYSDPRDADDARYSLNGREVCGSRIIVEFARGGPRGPGGSREYLGRGPPPGSGRCFNCGIDGHWARDCKAGDWKNKCYRCGEKGHIERNCQNSPKNLRSGRSYSRSPSRSPSPRRGRSRGHSYSRSQSYSRSRSRSPQREGRNVVRKDRSRSPLPNRSPKPKASPPPAKERKPSPSPDRRSVSPGGSSPRGRSPPPRESRPSVHHRGSDYSGSPRNSRSPGSAERDSPVDGRYRTPEANGRSGRSPSPMHEDDRSPVDDDRRRGSPARRSSDSPASGEE